MPPASPEAAIIAAATCTAADPAIRPISQLTLSPAPLPPPLPLPPCHVGSPTAPTCSLSGADVGSPSVPTSHPEVTYPTSDVGVGSPTAPTSPPDEPSISGPGQTTATSPLLWAAHLPPHLTICKFCLADCYGPNYDSCLSCFDKRTNSLPKYCITVFNVCLIFYFI